jgi:hypothetical protein
MGSCEKSGEILYPTQLNRQEPSSIIFKKKKMIAEPLNVRVNCHE